MVFWEPPSPFSSKNLHDVDAIIAILFYNQKSFSQQENPTLGHQMVPSTSQDTVLRSATRRLPSLLSKKAAWRWLASLLCELPPHKKKEKKTLSPSHYTGWLWNSKPQITLTYSIQTYTVYSIHTNLCHRVSNHFPGLLKQCRPNGSQRVQHCTTH